MTELARISTYDGLILAMRSRKAELGLSDLELDDRAGLCSGHAGKILGPAREKGIGPTTLELLLDALGLDLIVVARVGELGQRTKSHVRGQHKVGKTAIRRVMQVLARKSVAMRSRGDLAKQGRIGGMKSRAMLTKKQRQMAARRAALARWSNRPDKAAA